MRSAWCKGSTWRARRKRLRTQDLVGDEEAAAEVRAAAAARWPK